jgi:hypothetical protein
MSVTAIYHAPKDDSPVCEIRGVRFFDGHPVPLDSEEHAGLITKLRTNQHFEVEGGEEAARAGQLANGEKLTGLAKARAAKAAKKLQNQ